MNPFTKFSGIAALGLICWVSGVQLATADGKAPAKVPQKAPVQEEEKKAECNLPTAEVNPDSGNPNVRKFLAPTPDCKGVMIWTTNGKSAYQPPVDICNAAKSSTNSGSALRGCVIHTLYPTENDAKVGHLPSGSISNDNGTLVTYRMINKKIFRQEFKQYLDTVSGPNSGSTEAVKFTADATKEAAKSATEIDLRMEERKRSAEFHKYLEEHYGSGSKSSDEKKAGSAKN